jgi:hypothetical protein
MGIQREVSMRYLTTFFALAALFPTASLADQVGLNFGGDTYAAGQTTTISEPVSRDAFAAGYNVSLGAPVSGSAHMAGYNVNVNAPVGANLYAAGFAVTVTGTVARDITAMGNNVVINSTTATPGNARIAGTSLVLDSAIGGSLLATGTTLALNAPVSGDFTFYGENISFGPNARVDGKVSIQAPKEIPVPASVAAADRVTFQQITAPDYAGEAGKTAQNIMNGFWFAVWATVLWWLLLFVIGAAFISLAPRLVSDLATLSASKPFRRLGVGTLTLASTLGLVLVTVMTVLGIVLLPVVILYILVACSLAYLAGVYFVGARIWQAIRPIDSNLQRVVVLAVSLVLGGLVTMVPFLGWSITLLLLAFGFGLVAARTIASWGKADAAQLGSSPSSAPPAAALPNAV